MFRFTIRDVLWLMVVAGLVAVWRSDLARQEAAYLETLKPRFPWDREMRDIADKAKSNPKLLAEFKAFTAAEFKFSRTSAVEKQSLLKQYAALKEMAGSEPQPSHP